MEPRNVQKAMVMFYARLGLVLSPIVASTGILGHIAASAGRLVAFLVLLRRFLRCWRGQPSKACLGLNGKPLQPTIEGLHKRFLELYDASWKQPASNESKTVSGACGSLAEARCLEMLQFATLKDGQKIAYWDVGPRDAKQVVLLVNGLGGRIACWVPLLDALHTSADAAWAGRRLVILEYRGQFASVPLVGGQISVDRSAADVAEVVAQLRIQRATLLCWSTGVQVGLQFALDKPELVEAMILIQGTTGQALSAIGQPLCAVPGMASVMGSALSMLPEVMKSSGIREAMLSMLTSRYDLVLSMAGAVLWTFGTDLQAIIGVRYGQDMLQSESHFENYCGYALALGRHRIRERLPELKHTTLVVTGTPDFVTPARCSYELQALLGGDAELFDDVGGSHYYIYEEPHKLAGKIASFLKRAERDAAKPPAASAHK